MGAPPVQTADNGGFTTTAPGVSFGATTTVGNLVVLVGFYQSSSITVTSVTDGGGNSWNILTASVGTGCTAVIAWAVIVTGFGSCQFNLSASTTGDVCAAEYSGMQGAGTVFDTSAGSSGNSSSLTSGNFTPAGSGELIVAVSGVLQNSSTFTAGSGYTIEVTDPHSSQGNSFAFEDKNASGGSQAATMTCSVGGQWAMLAAAFKPTAVGSTVTAF